MIHDPDAPGLVLSPHPDDALLSAWSSVRTPGEVVICTVCTALPPVGTLGSFDAVFGVTDSAELMAQRLREDEMALASVGRAGRRLDLLDDQYRDGPLDSAALVAAIEDIAPEVAWMVAPAAIGAHPDHVAVRAVAIEIALAARVPLALYADLPYAVWAGWPHWVTGVEPRPYLVPEARWTADLASTGLATGELVARPVALGAAEAAAKVEALGCYRSQFAALNAGPLDRIRHPEIIGFELYWDVRPIVAGAQSGGGSR